MEEPILRTGNCPDLTRREFVQIGASVAAIVASGKTCSSTAKVERAFEHGNPLREFAYGDVHFSPGLHHAHKTYFDGYRNIMPDEWPCCSGTLPQVATDYHISTYFKDAEGYSLISISHRRYAGDSTMQTSHWCSPDNIC